MNYTKLYKHQIDGLRSTEGMNHVAYYWDMGLGKTFVGSEKMHQLGAKVNLLICQKSKIDDWIAHFISNYGGEYIIYNLAKHGNFEPFMNKDNSSSIVGVINYDLAWRRAELLKF